MTESNPKWESFALLLIDVQNDFWPDEVSSAFPDFEKNVGRLLKTCRNEKLDVVHLRAGFKTDRSDWMVKYRSLNRIPCVAGTPGAALLPCAKDIAGEKVIIKQTFDGFLNPDLHVHLIEHNKKYLLVAGLVTSVCVLLTAVAAAQRGYLVSVVEDCCADSPDAHVHALDRYPFAFDRVSVNSIAANYTKWTSETGALPAH